METSDKELFEQAISNETPTTVTAEPEIQPDPKTTEGVARDDHGRFAAKEQQAEPVVQPDPQAQPVTAQPTDKDAHVPSWRLREVNEAREAAERRATDAFHRLSEMEQQLAQFRQQPKQEPVDFFADPPGAFKQNIAPLESQIQNMGASLGLKVSRALAMVEHGKEAVAEMETAIGEAMTARHPGIPQLREQMKGSDDPVGVAMQWHQRERLLKETGGDLSAYNNRKLEEALKDPAFLAKALEAAKSQASGQVPGKGNNLVQLPPSIGRQTSAGSPHEEAGSMADRDLYAQAIR